MTKKTRLKSPKERDATTWKVGLGLVAALALYTWWRT